jgi:hypothetical protein
MKASNALLVVLVFAGAFSMAKNIGAGRGMKGKTIKLRISFVVILALHHS